MPAVDKETVFSNYQNVHSKTFVVSLLCEFVGVMVFSFLGTTVGWKPADAAQAAADKVFGPWVNGLALAITIYMAANISGGHLNPAVTMSTLLCGFYPLLHSLLYIALQITGAIFGSLLAAALLPGASINMGNGGPGCFDTGAVHKDLTTGQLFGWEVVMTFTLISVVYACGVAKPGHGSFTPLAVGLSLVACAGTGAKYTGAALNPARVIGPLAVFKCGGEVAWVYILAELLAALLACAIFSFVSGWGPLAPFRSVSEFGLSKTEAVRMWITGQPPKRFLTEGDENVTDLIDIFALGARGLAGTVLSAPTALAKSLGVAAKSVAQRADV